MTQLDIYKSLGEIDPKIIIAAAPENNRNYRQRKRWIGVGTAAGFAVLVVVVMLMLQSLQPSVISRPSYEAPSLPEGPYVGVAVSSDWQVYRDAKSLIEYADLILAGRVTDIGFQILDTRTALPADEQTPTYAKMLYTIYTVEVLESYQGDATDVIHVRIMGGMVGERTEEQLTLMESEGISGDGRGIPILEDYQKVQCRIGESYLFVLAAFETGVPTILNIDQSIYSLTEPTKENAVGQNPADYYGKKRDEYGYPLISAKDIIVEFGKKEWKEFYEKWKEGAFSALK
ncbi:MAG: hypothetical protein IJW40_12000 [Clostridia bacterium]|nr:hypothetical protein [Clostridia bacterium]MBQ7339157.1 hypothetical protein [Clostridia bacterium]